MTFLSALGEFPEMVLGLAFSFGCALFLAFVCLRVVVGWITRQRHTVTDNVIDDPSHNNSLRWLHTAVTVSGSGSDITAAARPGGNGDSGATGVPYLLPIASAVHGFARIAESDAAAGGRVVELPQFAAERVAQVGHLDGGDAA